MRLSIPAPGKIATRLLIAALAFTIASSPAQGALIAYYDFEGAATDKATADGTQSLTRNGTTYTTPGYGGTAQKLTFDGSNDYATNSTNFTENSPGITLTAWFNVATASSGGTRTIIHLQVAGGTSTQGAAEMSVNGTGLFVGGGRSDSSDTYQSLANGAVSANRLYFGAVVLDYPNKDIHLYLYDSVAGTWTTGSNTNAIWSENSLVDGNTAFRVGALNNNNNDFDGSIDEVRMYNTALTAGQVYALVPEPSIASLLTLVGGAVCASRRRRRSS